MEEENRCFRCSRTWEEVKLMDAIYDKEIVKVCEECSLTEDIPIIRKPASFQLKESEKPYTVYQRLSRMAGIPMKKEKMPVQIKTEITLDNLRKPKDYSHSIQQKQDQVKKANAPVNLIDNFHWHIQMARRDKKISLLQLASMIGESETALKLIEQNNLPDDANRIIGKIEQFFRINLRKTNGEMEQVRIENVKPNIRPPVRILNFNRETVNNITISDLRTLKEERKKYEMIEKDKEIASKLVWQGGQKKSEKEEQDVPVPSKQNKLIDGEIEFLDE